MGLVAEFEVPCERPPFLVDATHDAHAPIERVFADSAFVDTCALVGRAGETRPSSW